MLVSRLPAKALVPLPTKHLRQYIKAFGLDDSGIIEKTELAALIAKPLSAAADKAFRETVPRAPAAQDAAAAPAPGSASPNTQKRERDEREHQRRAEGAANAQRSAAAAADLQARQAQRAFEIRNEEMRLQHAANAERAAAESRELQRRADEWHRQGMAGLGGARPANGYPGNTGHPPGGFADGSFQFSEPGFMDRLFGVGPGTIPAFSGFGGPPAGYSAPPNGFPPNQGPVQTSFNHSSTSSSYYNNAPQQQQTTPRPQSSQQQPPAWNPQNPPQNPNHPQQQTNPRPPAAAASAARPAPSSALAPPTLADLLAASADPATLPTRTLKAVLTENKVNHDTVIEKADLVARVRRLLEAAKAEKELQERANARFEERASAGNGASQRPVSARRQQEAAAAADDEDAGLCKICCDKVVNCVFLECGHLVTCEYFSLHLFFFI